MQLSPHYHWYWADTLSLKYTGASTHHLFPSHKDPVFNKQYISLLELQDLRFEHFTTKNYIQSISKDFSSSTVANTH